MTVPVPAPAPPSSAPAGELEPERAVARYLTQILRGDGFPAIANEVQTILAWLQNDRTSVREVADVVLREYGLTLKVLKTANSTHYNRWGTSALTATHAIALIGARTIRDLVVGLMLFEHYQRKSPGLRELMLLSMLSANHARDLATRLRYPSPEEAYLCGMFRNLGEVLIACHFPEQYTRILALATEADLPPAFAARRLLGFPYEELGQAVCRHLGMTNIAAVMTPSAGAASALGAITALSHDLTTMAYRRPDGHPDPAIAGLRERFGALLPVTPEQLAEVVQAAIAETRETASHMGITLDPRRYDAQVAETLGVLGFPVDPSGAPAPVTVPPVAEAEQAAELRLEPGFDFDQALEAGLRGLAQAGGYERVVFCLFTPSRAELVGRLAWGEGTDALVERFRFPATSRTSSLGVAMLDQRDLFVTGRKRGEDRQFARVLGAEAFAILPLVVEHALVGCLYADRRDEGAPNERARALMLHWRRQVERALERRHLARRATARGAGAEATPHAAPTAVAPSP